MSDTPQTARFDGLLLDFGHVVLVTAFERHTETERGYGLRSGTLTWLGPFDPSTDALWRDHQAGRVSERDYWRIRGEEVERAAGRSGGLRDYLRVCFSGSEEDFVRPEIVALVADAKAAGIRVGLLTNEAELFHGREWIDSLAFFATLDAVVDASVTNILKPSPEAYRLALDALGLPAERVLFVDDQPANVAGAEAVGLPAVHFDVTDVAKSVALVRERLGLDSS